MSSLTKVLIAGIAALLVVMLASLVALALWAPDDIRYGAMSHILAAAVPTIVVLSLVLKVDHLHHQINSRMGELLLMVEARGVATGRAAALEEAERAKE